MGSCLRSHALRAHHVWLLGAALGAWLPCVQVDRVARQIAHRFLLPNGTWQEGFIPIAAPDNATAKAALYYVDGCAGSLAGP